jgi:hypothetical protein
MKSIKKHLSPSHHHPLQCLSASMSSCGNRWPSSIFIRHPKETFYNLNFGCTHIGIQPDLEVAITSISTQVSTFWFYSSIMWPICYKPSQTLLIKCAISYGGQTRVRRMLGKLFYETYITLYDTSKHPRNTKVVMTKEIPVAEWF